MKSRDYSSAGNAALKILATAAIGGILYFGIQIYIRVQDDAKRDKQLQAASNSAHSQAAAFSEKLRKVAKMGPTPFPDTEPYTTVDMSRLQETATANIALKAVSEISAELKERSAPWIALGRRFEAEKPTVMSTVKDKNDLAARRKFGEEFVSCHDECLSFMDLIESKLRDKLKKAGVPTAHIESAVKEFMDGWTITAPATRRLLHASETEARSLVAVTNLLEAQWGKWKAREGGGLDFDDNEIEKQYKAIVIPAMKAGEERIAARRELIELQKRK